MENDRSQTTTWRRFLGASAALASAAVAAVAQEKQVPRSPDHHLPNEVQPGPNNGPLDAENPSSVWAPETDNGTVKPFKYSFSEAH